MTSERRRLLRKVRKSGWTHVRRHSLVWGLAHGVVKLEEILRHHPLGPGVLTAWAVENRAIGAVEMLQGAAR